MPLCEKSFLAHVHPNPIFGFKDNMATPFVGLFGILFRPSLDVKSTK